MPQHPLQIRLAQRPDLNAISRFLADQASPANAQERQKYVWRNQRTLNHPRRSTIVAVHQNRVVGAISILKEGGFFSRGNCRVEDLAVHPDYRRRGVATGLAKAAVDYARQERMRRFCFFAPRERKGYYEKLIIALGLSAEAEEDLFGDYVFSGRL